jgi:c(7)-type cytochrome triheme protein
MKGVRGVAAGIAAMTLAIATATTGLAQTLPRLPGDLTFRGGEGSPGTVTFSHRSHLDEKKPECASCHPAVFRILKSSVPAKGARISHSSMEAGRSCGACHNDKAAFGLDKCDLCHRAE